MAARTRRSRPVVLRERNERGFALFLQNLKSVLNLLASADELETDNSLTHITDLLSSRIEGRNNVDFYDSLDISYSAPLNLSQTGRGRKRYEITKDQLEHLRSLYFSWEAIARILQVTYSEISDDELDEIYRTVTGSSSTGPLTPNIGRRRFIGALRSRGWSIQRWRVSDCLRRMDPVGTALRWRMTIHRRKYYVPTPNSLWHIDSGHKLIRYKLITHVCIDGKTRLILYAACRDNNKAETVLSLFQNANYHVGAYMIQHRGPARGSIITGSSVHNSRVERTHRDVYSGVLAFYSRVFQQLEDEGNLDVLNDVHIFSLHHIYIPRIQNSLEELVSQMNNRPVSTERNHSPLQMWERGMLENLHSGHTALSETEIEHLG
ncbi:unnamed protein product [Porites lobata]|uniref:Integrase catalytic domain-containing protein n=1 Tax=Porites lobata TaxID=104759 RepID=A0ABN8R417_9CNID|nr:unnamed protein product [Porites lobata]